MSKAKEAVSEPGSFIPEPDAASLEAQTYKVTGTQKVHDTEPGETFTLLLDPVQEALLIDSGAITKKSNAPTMPARKSTSTSKE